MGHSDSPEKQAEYEAWLIGRYGQAVGQEITDAWMKSTAEIKTQADADAIHAKLQSLERAFAIARRLRGSDVPYFQDTYGWILHRRGDAQEALRYLGPAAAALPDNALAQFHLAETERALGQRAAAGESYRRALAAAAAGSPLPAAETARQRLAEIEAATAPAPAPVPAPTDG